MNLHKAIKNRRCRLLSSPKRRSKPGPKGPGKDLIEAVVQMKLRNSTWVCARIAQQIALAFGIEINVERLIRPDRRECMNRALFWTTTDLESKLLDFNAPY